VRNSNGLSKAYRSSVRFALVDLKIVHDRNIYPDEATMAKRFIITARDAPPRPMPNSL